MRISFFVLSIQLCCSALLLANNIHAQSITLDCRNTPMRQLFNKIETQTGVNFVCEDRLLEGIPPVTIKVRHEALTAVLKNLEKQTPLRFKRAGNLIGVIRIKVSQPVPDTEKKIPSKTVNGRIIDENGQPLPGATIKVKGMTLATISDSDGHFMLNNVPDKAVLLVSFIGYASKEVPATEHVIVTLEKLNSKLDEVHVIAYGTTTERLSTGSISKVSATEIEKQPVSNPLLALAGRVPGMVVNQNSGLPGSTVSIQIRGRTSLENTSDPLYIIDGVPFNANSLDELNSSRGTAPGYGITGQSPFNSISPSDIESIEVLKDADATAIYGSRGANGVILITTKKGKAGKTKFNANIYSGAGVITRSVDYLNTSQYLAMRKEAFANDGITPNVSNAPDLLVWDNNRYTDWEKLLIGGTAHMTDASASISGGSDLTQFLIGTNYHYETTVFPGNLSDKRANVHLNLDHRSSDKKFYMNVSASYSNDDNNLITTDLTSAINTVPDAPLPYDANGRLNWSDGGVSFVNPLGYTQQPYNATTNNLISSALLQYTILPGLNIKVNMGYTNTALRQTSLMPKSSQNPLTNPVGSAIFGYDSSNTWIVEPQAEYKIVREKNTLDILVGSSWQQELISGNKISATNFSSDALINSAAAAGSVTATTNYDQYRYQAVFGRINYNYADKYIVNLTGRRDGSSRFGPGRQYANFGAVGAAWLFTNEDWLKGSEILSFGKLRGSYGITGNDKIGNYNYLDTYISTSSPYQGTSGLRPYSLSNADYAWEINKKLEAGLDLGFFNDRILITADYFRNRTGNELIQYTLPNQTGFSSILENFPAVVQNKGWEFSISSNNIKSKSFQWTTDFNISIERNKLVSFPGLATSAYAYNYLIGYPLDIRRLLISTGVNPQTGVYQFNGTNLPADEVSNTDITPKFYGGFNNTFRYKGFELSLFFQFIKQTGYNYLQSMANSYTPGTMSNQPVYVLNRWQKPGDQTDVQKFTTQPIAVGSAGLAYYYFIYYSNGIYSDASYIRLKNASLSYTLPSLFGQKLPNGTIKVYVQGQNLLTITGYKGNDPETGIVNGNYLPPLRVITAGIQLTY